MSKVLTARQENMVCGSGNSTAPYNLGLQVGALFIILTVSASACAFPLVAAKVPQLRVPVTFLFVVRHFGTGVLLAAYRLPVSHRPMPSTFLE